MRDIKFRGKRKDNGEWIIGDLVRKAFDGTSRTIDLGIRKPNRYPIEVLQETVGEFTGLKDNNGKDVYEGDGVKYEGAIGYVFYETESGMFMVRFKLISSIYSFDSMDSMYEIHGNIHENPELLNS